MSPRPPPTPKTTVKVGYSAQVQNGDRQQRFLSLFQKQHNNNSYNNKKYKSLPMNSDYLSFDQFVSTNELSKAFDSLVSGAVDSTCAADMNDNASLEFIEGPPALKTETKGTETEDGEGESRQSNPDIVLENRFYKLSRNKVWQERYFVFTSDGLLTYYHKKGDENPRASYQVTRDSGCQVSDLFVEQMQNGNEMASLYCMTFTWPDDNHTISSYPARFFSGHDSKSDDASFNIGSGASQQFATTDPASPARFFSGEKSKARTLQAFKSPFVSSKKSKKSSRTRSLSPERRKDKGGSSLYREPRHSSSWFLSGGRRSRPGSADSSLGSICSSDDNNKKQQQKQSKRSNRTKSPRHRGHASMSAIVGMEISPPIFQEYETILERDSSGKGLIDVQGSKDLNSNAMSEKDHYEPVQSVASPESSIGGENDAQKQNNKLTSYQNQHVSEQEELLNAYYGEQKAKLKEKRKELIQATKVGVAATAAVGVGVVTAGVGLAAGLVVLGAAAAAGGTAGAAEIGYKKFQHKAGKLTIATTSYEKAKLWISSVDACLESDTVVQSTWGQMFVAEGRKKTSMLVPHDVALLDVRKKRSGSSDDVKDFQSKSLDLPSGQSALFLRDRSFLAEEGAKWKPLEGGWISILGPGAQSLRIFTEEQVRIKTKSSIIRVARLAVGEDTSSPLKTQIVLKSNPLDAFMCAMSHAKIAPNAERSEDELVPNSGQSASFRLLEKMNEHMDIIHLVTRKLFLFPSWTEPRDYVLFRYWRYEPDGSYFVCYESVEHSSCPPQPGYVRGALHQALTFAPSKDFDKKKKSSSPSNPPECLVTVVAQVDPKGWVPTKHLPFLSNQAYSDAFGISALLQILDVRDAIERDRFLDVGQDLQFDGSRKAAITKDCRGGGLRDFYRHQSASSTDEISYDLRYKNRERCDSLNKDTVSRFETQPPAFNYDYWAEPDANSFMVRGPTYKKDRVKINAGSSVGKLVAVDLVEVDEPIYQGMAAHPNERVQRALKREKKVKEEGKKSDLPPFLVIFNLLIPGPPFYHLVLYYAIDDMKTIDGSDGTPFSKLCQKFIFGDSDEFRDKTFKLIPQIVEGNFIVRKAVGSTPAIMGKKLRQMYSRTDRYLELILDCASSQVATGVIKLSLGYAKTLMVDMGFVLEGDEEKYLPERIFGCCRLKFIDFTKPIRKVEPY